MNTGHVSSYNLYDVCELIHCHFIGVESLSSYYNYDPYDYYYYYWDYYNYDYDNSITGPIHMSNVRCLGTESRLIDCPHSVGGSGDLATLSCSNDSKPLTIVNIIRESVNSLRRNGADMLRPPYI